MKNILGISGLTVIIVMILSNSAHAYLDPGTGSMLVQALIAIIGAGTLFLGMFWRRVKTFTSRMFGKIHVKVDQHNDKHE